MTDSRTAFSAKWLPVLIGIGISVILIIVVAVTFFSGKGTLDTAVERYIKCCYMYDADAADAIAPTQVWTWLQSTGGVSKDQVVAYLDENAFVHTEKMYESFGPDINFSHDITDKETLDDSTKASLCDTYGIPLSAVDDARKLTVNVTVEGAVGNDTSTVTLTYFEMTNGEGYIVEAFPFLLTLSHNIAE